MAIAFVQQATAGTGANAGATNAVATISTAAGSCLVACIAVRAGSTTTITSVTDSASNVWTQLALDFLSGSSTRTEIWVCAGAAAVTTVTVTPSNTTTPFGFNVTEWSGVATATPLDVSAPASATGNASSTAPPSRTVATTNPADVVIGTLCIPNTAATVTLGGTFTALTTVTGTNTNSFRGFWAYQIETATGTYGPVWTLSAAAVSGAATVALKAAAAAALPDLVTAFR